MERSTSQVPMSDREKTNDHYLDQFTRLVTAHDLTALRYLITDGAYSKQKWLFAIFEASALD